MRINVAVPEAHVEAPVLNAALEATTRLNESLLKADEIPSFERGLKHGVKWKPEPPGAEHFDHAGTVMNRGWGDCDDLAPWHAASLRHTGEDPGAEAVVKRSGPNTWHAVVQRSDGQIDDPSKRAGMGRPHEYLGATLPLMWMPANSVSGLYEVRPQIALRPLQRNGQIIGVQARADMPVWHYLDSDKEPTPTDYAMASLAKIPVSNTALTGEAVRDAIASAIEGAVELGCVAGFAHDDHVDRLMAIHGVLDGVDPGDLAHEYGADHLHAARQFVGSFFGKLAHAFSPMGGALSSLVHNPLMHMASSLVPGGAAVLDMAGNVIPMHHGGGGGGGMPGPGPMFPGSHHGVSMHCVPFQ